LWFLDHQAYVEGQGFWVRGHGGTRVVLMGAPGQREMPLYVRNGAAPNVVTLDAGAYQQQLTLNSSEERLVSLPIAGSAALLDLRILAARGFRPSEISDSGDRRFLGIWVEPR
jgi:hypothetical protein